MGKFLYKDENTRSFSELYQIRKKFRKEISDQTNTNQITMSTSNHHGEEASSSNTTENAVITVKKLHEKLTEEIVDLKETNKAMKNALLLSKDGKIQLLEKQNELLSTSIKNFNKITTNNSQEIKDFLRSFEIKFQIEFKNLTDRHNKLHNDLSSLGRHVEKLNDLSEENEFLEGTFQELTNENERFRKYVRILVIMSVSLFLTTLVSLMIAYFILIKPNGI